MTTTQVLKGYKGFIAQLSELARNIERVPDRALTLASLGYAYVALGEKERGLSLAEEAHKLIGDDISSPVAITCLARVTASLTRAGVPNQEEVFGELLKVVQEIHSFARGKALINWFQALTSAGLPQSSARQLVDQGLDLVMKLPLKTRALLLGKLAPALSELGEVDRARRIVRDLLALPCSAYEPDDPAQSGGDGREIIYLEELTACLNQLGGDSPLSKDDAHRILSRITEVPEQVNEFTIDTALVAFRCDAIDGVALGDQLAKDFAAQDHEYASLNLRIAVLKRLAELGRFDEGRARLSALVEATNEHCCAHRDCEPVKDYHRLRLLQRLAKVIPAFGLNDEVSAQLDRISESAKTMNNFVGPNLLAACASAEAQLEAGPQLLEKLEGFTRYAIDAIEEKGPDINQSEQVCWVLESCVSGFTKLGDEARGRDYTHRLVDFLKRALPEQWSTHQFWAYRALVQAVKTAHELGDEAFARDLLRSLFKKAKDRDIPAFDRIDLLQMLIAAANNLNSALRFEVTAEILEEALSACQEIGEFGQEVLLNIVSDVAENTVSSYLAEAQES